MQVIAFLKNVGLAGGMLFLVVNGAKDFSLEKKKKIRSFIKVLLLFKITIIYLPKNNKQNSYHNT